MNKTTDESPLLVQAAQTTPGLAFERVQHHHGSTYKDASTVVVVPTRGQPWQPSLNVRWVQAFQGMISPMNQRRAVLYACGDEVGKAYNALIAQILADPVLSKWRFVLTCEDDVLLPQDAHVRLLESIEEGGFDAVSGIYFTKGDFNMPMAYGSPEEYARTGVLDFRPLDIRGALERGTVVPVNGIAMGISLYRMDLFKRVPGPWFNTVADVINGEPKVFTQDLDFCHRAVRDHGARFGVDMRVKCGHLDVTTGTVY
jgi:hypothetical protein